MRRQGLAMTLAVLIGAGAGNVTAAEQNAIDCSTARTDINALRNEKASNVERMAKGVTSIMPIGLVLNTVRGTEQKNLEIATGDYNDLIDKRIAATVHKCGID